MDRKPRKMRQRHTKAYREQIREDDLAWARDKRKVAEIMKSQNLNFSPLWPEDQYPKLRREPRATPGPAL